MVQNFVLLASSALLIPFSSLEELPENPTAEELRSVCVEALQINEKPYLQPGLSEVQIQQCIYILRQRGDEQSWLATHYLDPDLERWRFYGFFDYEPGTMESSFGPERGRVNYEEYGRSRLLRSHGVNSESLRAYYQWWLHQRFE